MLMNRFWFPAGVVLLFVLLLSGRFWRVSAEATQEAKGGDRLEKIGKQLEHLDKKLGEMEKTLRLIQKQIKELPLQKPGWQKVGDPAETKGDYIWMMNTETGKIKAIHTKSGNVYDK
jgi:hypothetical protein